VTEPVEGTIETFMIF